MKIPPWFPNSYGIHALVLRTKARCLTVRQRVLAFLARMYYVWIFHVVPAYEAEPLTTSSRVKASRGDGMSTLLWSAFNTKHWYSYAARLHARLKVLLCPNSGW